MLRQDVASLLQRVDELQQLLQLLLQQWERLLSEEYTQRRQLEKSVRSLAKRNYKLDKVQTLNPKSMHALRLPFCGIGSLPIYTHTADNGV